MARAAALLLLLLGLLPIVNWIPGGHEAPWYGDRLALWLSGGGIVLGVAIVGAIVLRHRPGLWRAGAWNRIARRWQQAGRRADAAIAAAALVAYGAVSQLILSARPLLIDEVIQLWQARVFASGRLFAPTAAHPEFTAAMHLVDLTDRSYGQFPAGGPAFLALGELVGHPWLVGPLVAALGVFLFARLVRAVELPVGGGLAAVLLFAFAPFTVFLSGSMMNHVPMMTCGVAAALALLLATRDDAPRPMLGLAAGLALGIGATLRPLDAVAFALPTACWLAWRVVGDRRQLRVLLASGIGVLLPVAALLAINGVWTGDPTRFGYIELWGRSHELGFHETPWGPPHTPARGLELVNLYLLRLQTYFLETPVPGLLFATGALALTVRLRNIERWMLAGGALMLLAYFGYWHDGFYLGPRFLLPLAPWLAWWTASLPAAMRDRGAPLQVERAVVLGGLTALAIGALQLAPIRATQYRNGMLSMRLDAGRAADDAGITGSLVLARESWGAQLIVRLWALGVPRADAEQIYRTTDACALDAAIAGVERDRGGVAMLTERLEPLRADSTLLRAQMLSPDTTLRMLPGRALPERCQRRLAEDQAGTTVFAPLLLAGGGDNIFVRDLHARDTLLPPDWLARPQFLLTQEPGPGGALRFERVDPDSQHLAWRRDAGLAVDSAEARR